jgi:16S rRNA (guanine(1405)-N(7))-methyltransferase
VADPELVARAVDAVVARYRADAAEVRGLAVTLIDAARLDGPAATVLRTRAWRELVSSLRKEVYYRLRRYRTDESLAQASSADAVLDGHASTRERSDSLAAFHRALFAALGSPETLVDVGCGVYPLAFPFEREGACLRRYVAADRDPRSIAAVTAHAARLAAERLVALRWQLADGWAPLCSAGGTECFDAALLLKLVPVIARQERAQLAQLARVPARRIVVSGSKQALAKRESIERRERAVLSRFARQSGRSVCGEFETAGEFAMVLE